MALLKAGDLYQVRFYCSQADQVAINVRHYSIRGVDDDATDNDLADALATNFAGPYKAALSGEAEYRGLSVQRLQPGEKSTELFKTTGAGAGTGTGDVLPRQVSGLIALVTEFAGRSFRGRVYVPFPGEDDNAIDGAITGGYLAKLNALGAEYIRTIRPVKPGGTLDAVPVIYSRKSEGRIDAVGWRARLGFATQRRRGFFGAKNISPI